MGGGSKGGREVAERREEEGIRKKVEIETEKEKRDGERLPL